MLTSQIIRVTILAAVAAILNNPKKEPEMSEASRAYEEWRALEEQQELIEEQERVAAARAVLIANGFQPKDNA